MFYSDQRRYDLGVRHHDFIQDSHLCVRGAAH
jgi:hypothetical protein